MGRLVTIGSVVVAPPANVDAVKEDENDNVEFGEELDFDAGRFDILPQLAVDKTPCMYCSADLIPAALTLG